MNGLEKRLRERTKRFDYPVDITEHDLNARYLIGWPGYRNAQNKSGLGYVETQAEQARMFGLFIKWLATGKFQMRNPVFLLVMTLIGLLSGGFPTFFILHEVVIRGNWAILRLPVAVLLILAISDLLLINAILSIVNRKGKTITGD